MLSKAVINVKYLNRIHLLLLSTVHWLRNIFGSSYQSETEQAAVETNRKMRLLEETK